ARPLAGAYARSLRLHAVGLRYFTVYGPRQRPDMAFARVVEALAFGRPFEVYGDGTQSRSFTYVADVVDATIRALDAPAGAIYNVGGGEEASLREAIALLEEIAGHSLDVSYGRPAPGDMRRTRADTTRIERALGWHAVTPLQAGLRAHWSWASGRVARRWGAPPPPPTPRRLRTCVGTEPPSWCLRRSCSPAA